MAKKKQMCELMAGKGMPRSLSNEFLRNYSQQSYARKLTGNFDPSREKLDFEVTKGGVIVPVNKKYSVTDRFSDNLKARGILNPNAGLKSPKYRTLALFVLGGSREQMHQLSFGDQQVNLNRGADNSHIIRNRGIERWAVDAYNFMASKYGEDNIVAFVVHLDETNPHVHCAVIPVNGRSKISWKQVMAGKDKYEYSARMKQLHDEFAKVNEKYGLERGDPISETGARHKTYTEWQAEQAAKKEQYLHQIDKNIDTNRQIIYNLNAEISKAERRVKGLTTMLSNLEAQKKDIEDKISSLESQLLQGQIDADEMNRRKAVLFNGLNDLKCKIKERELQLVNARNSLQDVADQKVELEKKATIVEKQLRVNLSELHKKTIGEMQTTAWKVAAEDFVERLQKSKDYIDHLPSNERKIVEDFNEVVFDGSIIEDMALHANEIAAVSSALFLGYLDGAINFTQTNGGGGSSPDPDWGRNKDDDDEAWRRKCFFMGMKMMRPANKQVKQIKNDKGGIRR